MQVGAWSISMCVHVCMCTITSFLSDSLWPHGLKPARLLCPWDSPDNNTGVVAMSSSRGSSWPRVWTRVSLCFLHCRLILHRWPTKEAYIHSVCLVNESHPRFLLHYWNSTHLLLESNTPPGRKIFCLVHKIQHNPWFSFIYMCVELKWQTVG